MSFFKRGKNKTERTGIIGAAIAVFTIIASARTLKSYVTERKKKK
jgi:hypothetical protein